MAACDEKSKETRISLYFSITGDIFEIADNCVEGAPITLLNGNVLLMPNLCHNAKLQM